MKRKLILVTLILVTAICLGIDKIVPYNIDGVRVSPGQVHTVKSTWVALDATTSTGDEPNDLAVGERTYTTVVAAAEGGDAEITIYGDSTAERLVMSSWNVARFRCIGIADNNSVTYQVYAGTLGIGGTDCELVKIAQLAFTIGTQVSTTSGYELADTLTVTEYCWPKSFVTKNPGSNLVAETSVDLMGADILVAVPTTVGCDCKLLIKGF